MSRLLVCLALVLIFSGSALGDIYMQNPRGSNNRNCETNENRNNANRLFDSQNNDKGGYPCPRDAYQTGIPTKTMYYLVGSVLPIQWTAQHSCGYGNNDCQIILQYACNDTLQSNVRDGAPNSATDSATNTVNVALTGTGSAADPNVGVHESYTHYTKCATRKRNQGLYIADQASQNNGQLTSSSTSTETRQNANGNRYGFECQEERDYYPYWHPSPWRDIAIFTTNTSNCGYYQANSQNVISTGDCYDKATQTNFLSYNNYGDCLANSGAWVVTPSKNMPAPQCFDTSSIVTRDNILGATANGQHAGYNWTIPSFVVSEQCILRIRYNISTSDIPWGTDSTYNNGNSPTGSTPMIVQNPFRDYGHGWPLHLAFNTNQGGRTFQDRSYVFAIRNRPFTVPSYANIYNINVRGKRGNIVQTYPAVEYDFVPEYLQVTGADYVHFQWTGSDYNVARDPNDANGGPQFPDNNGNNGARSDRSNVAQLDYQSLSVPRAVSTNTMFSIYSNGQWGPDYSTIYQMAFLGQPINVTNPLTTCLNLTQLAVKNNVAVTGTNGQTVAVTAGMTLTASQITTIVDNQNVQYDPQNCGKLNAAGVYYDAGPLPVYASGRFNYYSTRNNAFSNRSQKGILVVQGGQFAQASTMKLSGGVIFLLMMILALI